MKNTVSVRSLSRGLGVSSETRALIKRSVLSALEQEGIAGCEVAVFLTDDSGIHKVNLEQRNVDMPTDVLSFPLLELAPGEKPLPSAENINHESGLVPLGDILISVQRAEAQAKEYGHSAERETAFLCVHSVLHLLGYDHTDNGPEQRKMRGREEEILAKLGLKR